MELLVSRARLLQVDLSIRGPVKHWPQSILTQICSHKLLGKCQSEARDDLVAAIINHHMDIEFVKIFFDRAYDASIIEKKISIVF